VRDAITEDKIKEVMTYAVANEITEQAAMQKFGLNKNSYNSAKYKFGVKFNEFKKRGATKPAKVIRHKSKVLEFNTDSAPVSKAARPIAMIILQPEQLQSIMAGVWQ
jgi:hypothetical protein